MYANSGTKRRELYDLLSVRIMDLEDPLQGPKGSVATYASSIQANDAGPFHLSFFGIFYHIFRQTHGIGEKMGNLRRNNCH